MCVVFCVELRLWGVPRSWCSRWCEVTWNANQLTPGANFSLDRLWLKYIGFELGSYVASLLICFEGNQHLAILDKVIHITVDALQDPISWRTNDMLRPGTAALVSSMLLSTSPAQLAHTHTHTRHTPPSS